MYYTTRCIAQQKGLNSGYLLSCTMEAREQILGENVNEYLTSAEKARGEKRFNVAVTLFFKAICAATDLFLLQQARLVPSSHTHRFRVLEEKYPDLYRLLDKDFPFYQDSYTKKMTKEAVEVLREDALQITKRCKIRTEK